VLRPPPIPTFSIDHDAEGVDTCWQGSGRCRQLCQAAAADCEGAHFACSGVDHPERVAEEAGAPSSYGTIAANDPTAVRKLRTRLDGKDVELRVAYEAGATGYTLHRQLTKLGMACMVVAPSLIPVRPGDKVKTDRRDALKLARLLRSGDLTSVWVPDREHEALRNLVRARADAKVNVLRAKHRLSKFLLRLGTATGWHAELVAALLSVAADRGLRASR
jgi:transposase